MTDLLLVRPRHGAPFQSRGCQPIRETGRSGSSPIPTNVKPVQGEYAQVPHVWSRSCGDSLVITPCLTNHNRDLEISLGLVYPRAGLQVGAYFCVSPTWANDQHYTTRWTPERRESVTKHPSPASTRGRV